MGDLGLNASCEGDTLVCLMRIARTALIGTVALLWVLAASHCLVETVPGLEFLHCSAEAQTSSPDNHGCDDSCCGVESAGYEAQRRQHFILTSIIPTVPSDVAVVLARSLPPEVSLGILTTAPPEFCRTWQFLFRTALLARAPSLAS